MGFAQAEGLTDGRNIWRTQIDCGYVNFDLVIFDTCRGVPIWVHKTKP